MRDMIEVRVIKTEWYPVFDIDDYDGLGKKIRITKEQYDFIKRVFYDFDRVQELLAQKYSKE